MESRNGMLYPMMVIAAISVILFSVIGIATMTGHIPSALSQKGDLTAPTEALAAKETEVDKAHAAKPTGTESQGAAERRALPTGRHTATVCGNCGVVESVQAQEVKGRGTGLGAVGGAVIGGVLGHQVGSGRGKDVATVAGAVGGGFAGNEIEKNVKKTTQYVIRVRMEDGTQRTLTQSAQPGVAAGDHVRIENGAVVARG